MNKSKTLKKIYRIFLAHKSVCTDTRILQKNDIFFALSGENFNGNTFAKKALEKGAFLVVGDDEQEIAKQFPAEDFRKMIDEGKIIIVESTLETLQDLAQHYRENISIPFLGITGSNGKTTTKELVRDVLAQKYTVLATEGNFNNHIGVPLTILSIKPEHEFAIIEMGANHVGEIELLSNIAKPDYGLITNIGKAHIGEFGGFENIVKGKAELYAEVFKNRGTIFVNFEDELLLEKAELFPASQKVFYSKASITSSEKFLEISIEGATKKKKIKTNLVGEYNIFNLQAAFCIGKFFDIQEDKIIKALESYLPENNRSQIIQTKKGNEIIMDAYNANPTSMNAAIDSFVKIKTDKEKLLILGSMAELGEFSQAEHQKILEKVKNTKIQFLLYGEGFEKVLHKETSRRNSPYRSFHKLDSFMNFIKENIELQNRSILIKGSRSQKLENILELL